MVTICTASLTFNNSTFCPHSVFMCFVWVSEQTAIISLYSINWLVCITETECAYCAVRAGSLNDSGYISLYSVIWNINGVCSFYTTSVSKSYWQALPFFPTAGLSTVPRRNEAIRGLPVTAGTVSPVTESWTGCPQQERESSHKLPCILT